MAASTRGRGPTQAKVQRATAKAMRVATRQSGAAARQSEDTVVAKIHERPLQAVVCALSLGFVLGVIWRI